MLKSTFLFLIMLVLLFAEEDGKTTQGYAQYQRDACDISVKKALKYGDEKDILSRCSCYKQDGNDWLCYTVIKPTK